ncbi:MAG: hypothetical protein EOO80_14920, partial [Oxalobacteraceae bacterium]
PAAAVMPHVRAGKLRALAVATAKRSAVLPELPTLAGAGVGHMDDVGAAAGSDRGHG